MSTAQAAATAFHPDAPADERVEALGHLQAAHMPGVSELLPPEPVRALVEHVRSMYEEQDMMAKAINANVVPFPSARSKQGQRGMQSVQLDELNLSVVGDYFERPGALPFEALRSMVDQTPVLSSVVLTRQRQVQRFCRPGVPGTDKPGFEIRHIDSDHKLTPDEQQQVQQLTRFISNCGWEFKPRHRKALKRDPFHQFMAKAVRDTLSMDSTGIELEWKRDAALGIDGFYAVDGATIRLCTELGYRGIDSIFALQVVQGRICTAYSYEDLVYEPRNPRSDVTAAGYGLSETELLIKVVTGFLNAMTLNIKGFDSNAIPKGMLHLSGNYTQDDLNAFKRYWNSMVRGVNNAWSLPVMISKDQESKASFERFGLDFNEMYFAKWMTFLTSIICAIFGMSPAEINFDSFSGGNTSPLAGSDTEEKITASKDSGLWPLLSYFESVLSENIVADFGPWAFGWTGLEREDADKKHEMRKLVLTVDEARAEEGYKPHPNPMLGSAPLNPTLVGPWQQAQQAAQQQGPDFGAAPAGQPGAGDGEPVAAHGDFGDGHPGDFGREGAEDFGSDGGGLDFGKAMPLVLEVDL